MTDRAAEYEEKLQELRVIMSNIEDATQLLDAGTPEEQEEVRAILDAETQSSHACIARLRELAGVTVVDPAVVRYECDLPDGQTYACAVHEVRWVARGDGGNLYAVVEPVGYPHAREHIVMAALRARFPLTAAGTSTAALATAGQRIAAQGQWLTVGSRCLAARPGTAFEQAKILRRGNMMTGTYWLAIGPAGEEVELNPMFLRPLLQQAAQAAPAAPPSTTDHTQQRQEPKAVAPEATTASASASEGATMTAGGAGVAAGGRSSSIDPTTGAAAPQLRTQAEEAARQQQLKRDKRKQQEAKRRGRDEQLQADADDWRSSQALFGRR
jgi:hypothetical protein